MPDESRQCATCGGTRFLIRQDEAGYERAVRCDCTRSGLADKRLEGARIPARYHHCDLAGYEDHHDTQRRAKRRALDFVERFPDVEGLLLTGPCGVGKTHLAVGILRALILDKGCSGVFVDFRDLLKEIQDSWTRRTSLSQSEVLQPVLRAELLVLDDLGASKPTDWVCDTLGHVINRRYNEKRFTLFTTNYSDELAGEDTAAGGGGETLIDRIGVRLRSRLDEMCEIVEISGRDYRRHVRQAARW